MKRLEILELVELHIWAQRFPEKIQKRGREHSITVVNAPMIVEALGDHEVYYEFHDGTREYWTFYPLPTHHA